MTQDQIKSLKVGDTILFTYSDGRRQAKGEVVRIARGLVRIEWEDQGGWTNWYSQKDLNSRYEVVS